MSTDDLEITFEDFWVPGFESPRDPREPLPDPPNLPKSKTKVPKYKADLKLISDWSYISEVASVAIGGINEKNFKRINILNAYGCALLKDKKKAGKYMPAFLKNNF